MIRVNPTGKMKFVCLFKRWYQINIGQVVVITAAKAREKATEILNQANQGNGSSKGKINFH